VGLEEARALRVCVDGNHGAPGDGVGRSTHRGVAAAGRSPRFPSTPGDDIRVVDGVRNRITACPKGRCGGAGEG